LTDWDSIEIAGWADGEPYQSGTLAEIMPLSQLLEAAAAARGPLGDGDVLFLGTLPVLGGGLRPSVRFEGEIRVPDLRHSLRFSYTIEVRA
jgi:4-hydroxyphenylacetate 3-monooxygenase